MKDALYEIESIRRFAGFSSVLNALPDETTILNFRHLLEEHKLTEKILTAINAHLEEQGLLASQDTMMDATIIHAPTSTKNKDKACDPDMHSTRKGNEWFFGMKAHVGANVASGAVHTVTKPLRMLQILTNFPIYCVKAMLLFLPMQAIPMILTNVALKRLAYVGV